MRTNVFRLPMYLVLALVGFLPLHAQDQNKEKVPTSTTPVQMTVTVRLLDENKRMPDINREDVIVTQGKERLRVTGWTPVHDERAIEMFLLIDDAASTHLGSQLSELRSFISAQPETTLVGVGYMHNGTVQIVQNLTTDRDKAAKALRLPLATSGAFGSPYLSAIDLMKRWPDSANRHEIVMITDGIDRFRGPYYRGFYFSPDVDSASRVAQRTGTVINTIFARGIGRRANNYWEITNGQNGMAKLSDETGGESYYLGTQDAVSFKPYFDDLQRSLDNKYLLEFHVTPGKKAGPLYVKLATEVAGVELDSADSVWVKAR
jgi:hypothetical protein